MTTWRCEFKQSFAFNAVVISTHKALSTCAFLLIQAGSSKFLHTNSHYKKYTLHYA